MPTRFWVVQVGINSYRHHTDLDGCVNDVALIRSVLEDRFGAEPERIVTLLNDAATRDGILAALTGHLLDNEAIEADDEIVFHFSGHGVRASAPREKTPTGFVECLLPHDAGEGDALPIPDFTLDALLTLIAERRTTRITFIADCCHSGNLTRHESKTGIRRVDAIERDLPPELDLVLRDAARVVRPVTGATPWTALSACRNTELARETFRRVGGRPHTYGIFSWFLAEAMTQMVPGTTYGTLADLVSTRVSGHERFQQPQCEGQRHRVVFGGQVVERTSLPFLIEVDGERATLSAGALHGVRMGDIFALVPPEALTDPQAPETALGQARVIAVHPTRSQVALIEIEPDADLLAARGRRMHAVASPIAVSVDVGRWDDDGALRELVEASPWLRVAEADSPPDLRLVDTHRRVPSIASAAGEVIADQPYVRSMPTLKQTVGTLEAIARYGRFCALSNDDPRSRLQGRLSLGLRWYDPDRPVDDMERIEPGPDGRVIPYRAGRPRPAIIDVVNRGRRAMYPNIFLCNQDYSITLLYPIETGDLAVPPGGTLHVGLRTPAERVEFYLPGDEAGETWWDASDDRIVLIGTSKPTRLDMLAQSPLGVPPPDVPWRGLAEMLRLKMRGRRHTRRMRIGEDWGVAGLTVRVIRVPDDEQGTGR